MVGGLADGALHCLGTPGLKMASLATVVANAGALAWAFAAPTASRTLEVWEGTRALRGSTSSARHWPV